MTAVLLAEDVLSDVGHEQWVLVMPRMLRPYFLYHRELLGGLVRAAWETAFELMSAAVVGESQRAPGNVWPRILGDEKGRRRSRDEEAELLGYGPAGV